MSRKHRHKKGEPDLEAMKVEDDRQDDDSILHSRKFQACAVCWGLVAVLLLVTMLPSSFSYVEYNQYAFKKNSLTNFVDQNEVFENGRYYWGLFREPLTFPSTFQVVSFKGNDLLVFSKTGLEFSLECDIFYRLKKENLPSIFTNFGTTYHTRFMDEMRASIKNTAPLFEVDDYINNRRLIEKTIMKKLNEDLKAKNLFLEIEEWKFLLRRAVFPAKIRDIFLKTAVQELNNDKSVLEQKVILIKKETEEQVQGIQANITIVTKVADANAEAVVEKGNAEAVKIVQEATGEGFNYLLTSLNATEEADRDRLFRLFAILDNPSHPKILVGKSLNPLINIPS